jgi:GPI-anchor transamidase subunit U
VFSNLFVLAAIANAAHGATTNFLLAISLASYISLHPILLFPPLVMLCYDAMTMRSGKQSPLVFAASQGLGLIVNIGSLLYTSMLLTGSWEYLKATYGVRLLLPDLTPNVGLWWYFFIEMFDSFREFFLGVFWLHMASYTGAMCLRISKQPLFVAITLIGISAIFQPYPSIADTSLYLALLPLYRHIFPRKYLLMLLYPCG